MARDDAAYLPIRDYALIGNSRTAALIGTDGSIDWYCHPRFDSPAVFCRLLDAKAGGRFRVRPTGAFASEREYLGPTPVLRTRFKTSDAVVELTDFMPLCPAEAIAPEGGWTLLRKVKGVTGTAELQVEIRPTFGFATAPTKLFAHDGGALARSEQGELAFGAPCTLSPDAGGALRGTFRIRAGERLWLGLGKADGGSIADAAADASLRRTLDSWSAWSGRCVYEGPYEEVVRRSAITLKLLTYQPSGALVAAPTTSLPEQIGGIRNWDYRYAWLRDSALILHALQSLGHTDEAVAFFHWLEGQCIECLGDLQIMYAVDGDPELPEQMLAHLEGYRRSSPVRVGNAAALQRQLDIYGEVLDAAYLYRARIGQAHPKLPDVLWLMANRAAAHWEEPDEGIWEVRGGRKHFLHSKLLCWVAVDRALRMKDLARGGGDAASWERARAAIGQAILSRGYDEKLGAFVQALGESELDASALMLPLVGFLPPTDARVRSTISVIQERLTSNGLVYRYLAEDGLPGREGAFLLCTLWMVDNLALAGRVDEARQLFERVVSYSNDVGLLSEEVDPTSGELLGNFPQGFTHLGLIRSAMHIAEAERHPRAHPPSKVKRWL